MKVTVRKLTDRELMLEACESTFAGKSNQSLLSMYKSEHSPSRTQLFWIKLEDIPLYVASHLVRHHVGTEKFQLTHRTDRKGGGASVDSIIDELHSCFGDASDPLLYGKELGDKFDDLIKELKDKSGRMAPTNLTMMTNAQSLIDMAKLRLCKQASKHTQEVYGEIVDEIYNVDSELAVLMVPKCIYRNGLCGEPKPCGFNKTDRFKKDLKMYLINFTESQSPSWGNLIGMH